MTLAVAVIVGLPATANGQEEGDGDTVEVRIAAQRRLSGKIEFALQQRESDGDWGTRLLPDQRFFPTATRVGTWLVSTPLSLESASNDAGDDAAAGDSVARIVARRLADGRVEFVLQQQLVVGGWGERLLPDRQYFPVGAAVGRWFVSSPLTLMAAEQSANGAGLPPPIDPTDTTTVPDSTTTNTGVSPGESAIPAAEAEMADLVNTLRRSLGLAPLAYHTGLASVAGAWSEEMQKTGEFHHNPIYSLQYPGGWRMAGENIFWSSRSSQSLSTLVQNAHDALVGSPGHYANLTNPAFTHIGIGIVLGHGNLWGSGSLWITQNFAQYPPGTTDE